MLSTGHRKAGDDLADLTNRSDYRRLHFIEHISPGTQRGVSGFQGGETVLPSSKQAAWLISARKICQTVAAALKRAETKTAWHPGSLAILHRSSKATVPTTAG